MQSICAKVQKLLTHVDAQIEMMQLEAKALWPGDGGPNSSPKRAVDVGMSKKKSSQHDSDKSENQSNSPKMMYPYKTWQNIWVEQVNFSLPSIELLLEVGVYHLLGYTHPSHRRPTDLQQLIYIPVPTNATFLGKESLARTVPRLNMANLQQGRVRYLVFGPNCRQCLGLLPW